MTTVVVLNADYTFLNFIDWRKAMTLIAKERVEVIKYSDEIINTVKNSFKIPLIVKLTYIVDLVYKRKISFSYTNVFIRDDCTCGYCGKKFNQNSKELTVDHIIPRSLGGKNDWLNCITACKICNNKKSNKSLEDLNMKLLWKPYVPTISQYILKKLNISGHYKYIKELYNNI